MGLKSAKLTPEQERYWKTLLIRCTNSRKGQPALAYLFFAMTPYNVEGLQTMGLDKRLNVYVDFDYFMKEKTLEYAAGVLNHEPWHWLRRHHQRYETLDALDNGKAHNPLAWNHAGDLAINEALGKISEGGLVPDDGLFPGSTPYENVKDGQTTEAYYKIVMSTIPDVCPDCGQPLDSKDKNDQDQNGKDSNNSQSGNQTGDQDSNQSGDNQGQGDSSDQGDSQQGQPGDQGSSSDQGQNSDQSENGQGDGSEGSGSGSGQGDSQQGNSAGSGGGSQSGHTCPSCGHGTNGGQGGLNGSTVKCGSGAGNKPGEYEIADGKGGVDDDKADQIRAKVASEIKKQAQSHPGTVHSSFTEWAEQELATKPLGWRKILRSNIRGAANKWTRGKLDYNKKRPNRRQPIKGLLLPALMAPTPRVGVGVDTSGSHLHKLGVVVDQVTEITKQIGVRGRDLLAFDVAIQVGDAKPVNNPRKLLENFTNSGGTDMRVGIEQLHKLHKERKIDIGILLTDLQTPWPDKRPDDNMPYIIVGIVDGSEKWETEWIERTEKAIGDWAKIVIVDINQP